MKLNRFVFLLACTAGLSLTGAASPENLRVGNPFVETNISTNTLGTAARRFRHLGFCGNLRRSFESPRRS
jgi:hypothetical protein